MPLLPVTLSWPEGSLAVVVGGGPVAERKVRTLLNAGLEVRVVSPQVTPALAELAAAGRLTWVARPYRTGDLAGACLVCAATNVRAVNAAVAQEARARAIPVNVADRPQEGTVRFPALFRADGFLIAVNTEDGRPRRAQAVRDWIADLWPQSPHP